MICEKGYYPNGNGENREKIHCKDNRVTEFNGKCPFVYWCNISGKFENTIDMLKCKYRGDNSD